MRYIDLMEALFEGVGDAPPMLRRAKAVQRLLSGESLAEVGRELRFSRAHLGSWLEAVQLSSLHGWLGKPVPTPDRQHRARAGIAQMLLGALAEDEFEGRAKDVLGESFGIDDDRVGRTDTDYIPVQTGGARICRFNIKVSRHDLPRGCGIRGP